MGFKGSIPPAHASALQEIHKETHVWWFRSGILSICSEVIVAPILSPNTFSIHIVSLLSSLICTSPLRCFSKVPTPWIHVQKEHALMTWSTRPVLRALKIIFKYHMPLSLYKYQVRLSILCLGLKRFCWRYMVGESS